MVKICPMLTGKEERKAVAFGQGDVVVPTFRECLQEHCAAFIVGKYYCNHYHTCVLYEEGSR